MCSETRFERFCTIISTLDFTVSATIIAMVMLAVQDMSGLWIGMSDLNNNQRFTWHDNTPVAYTNWDKAEPETLGVSKTRVSLLRYIILNDDTYNMGTLTRHSCIHYTVC